MEWKISLTVSIARRTMYFTAPGVESGRMSSEWDVWLARWTQAGLLDAPTADRIRAFEASHDAAGSTRLRWPILIALGIGALMVAGGVLLFVAANWDALSPGSRFALVLVLVSIFHIGGAATAAPFPAMSQALHGIGTVALGGGIALSGQIFNLDEHWPAGIMLWAGGAALAWAILRHTTQVALVALLVPAWLIGEWIAATEGLHSDEALKVGVAGILLLALTYLAAVEPDSASRPRRALMWIGAGALPLAAAVLALITGPAGRSITGPAFAGIWVIGWTTVFTVPLALAGILRGRDAWPTAVAALWMAALVFAPGLGSGAAEFGWWGLGACGLMAWGVRDGRSERINLGAAAFAATVLVFYFSQVMDKLGRASFLLVLGLLFLGGGWALERMRRQLVARSRENR
jgi:hypothetical protein